MSYRIPRPLGGAPQVAGSPLGQLGSGLQQLGMLWLMNQRTPQEQYLDKVRAEHMAAQAGLFNAQKDRTELGTNSAKALIDLASQGSMGGENGSLSHIAAAHLAAAYPEHARDVASAVVGSTSPDPVHRATLLTGRAVGYNQGVDDETHKRVIAAENQRAAMEAQSRVQSAYAAASARGVGANDDELVNLMRIYERTLGGAWKAFGGITENFKSMLSELNYPDKNKAAVFLDALKQIASFGYTRKDDLKRAAGVIAYLDATKQNVSIADFLELFNDQGFDPVKGMAQYEGTPHARTYQALEGFAAANQELFDIYKMYMAQANEIAKRIGLPLDAGASQQARSALTMGASEPGDSVKVPGSSPVGAGDVAAPQVPSPPAEPVSPGPRSSAGGQAAAPPAGSPGMSPAGQALAESARNIGETKFTAAVDVRDPRSYHTAINLGRQNYSIYSQRNHLNTPDYDFFAIDKILYQKLPGNKVMKVGPL